MSSSIPEDILHIQRIMEEYGFNPDNCDPVIINQIICMVNRMSKNVYEKADIIRETYGDRCVTDEHFQAVLSYGSNIHAGLEMKANTEQDFKQRAQAINLIDIEPHPITAAHFSLPLPTFIRAQHDFRIDYHPNQEPQGTNDNIMTD